MLYLCENYMAKVLGFGMQLQGIALLLIGTMPFPHSPWQIGVAEESWSKQCEHSALLGLSG